MPPDLVGIDPGSPALVAPGAAPAPGDESPPPGLLGDVSNRILAGLPGA